MAFDLALLECDHLRDRCRLRPVPAGARRGRDRNLDASVFVMGAGPLSQLFPGKRWLDQSAAGAKILQLRSILG
jgi:hypothetical protein